MERVFEKMFAHLPEVLPLLIEMICPGRKKHEGFICALGGILAVVIK